MLFYKSRDAFFVIIDRVVSHRSVEWGEMPFHWYFTSALPRSLLVAYPLSWMAPFVEKRIRSVALIALIYVVLYSKLNHKEVPHHFVACVCFIQCIQVRFLFPVLPLFNLSASAAFVRCWRNRSKSIVWKGILFAGIFGSVISYAAAILMLLASMYNYPGGQALQILHTRQHYSPRIQTPICYPSGKEISVHIGTLPAMTGITRFAELHPCWTYSKVSSHRSVPLLYFFPLRTKSSPSTISVTRVLISSSQNTPTSRGLSSLHHCVIMFVRSDIVK